MSYRERIFRPAFRATTTLVTSERFSMADPPSSDCRDISQKKQVIDSSAC
jgi:hypothetical protein